MKVRECMRRSCALVASFALVVYGPGNGALASAVNKSEERITVDSTKNESVNYTETTISEQGRKESDKTGKKDYIVKTTSKSELNKVRKDYSESDEINENGENHLTANRAISLEMSKTQAERLSQSDTIKYVEEDKLMTASGNKKNGHIKEKKRHEKKITKYKKNTSKIEWNRRMVNAKDTDSQSNCKIKVAVLDSGIDWGNDINLVYQVSLVPGEEEMTQIFMDGSGHGSSVASLIAANKNEKGITGINPNVDIYSYRVLDDANQAPVSRVIEAIYMAIDQNVNIINMSFGMADSSEALEEAIHIAKEKGILIIAAAGNTGEKGVQYPAAYEEVMAVGAVNKDGEVEDYSAKGREVEVVAPGELVKTTGFIGSEEVTSGTSLAAPQVTAVASLIWQRDSRMSADFVRGLLDESANLYGNTSEYGNGLIDAEYALSHYDEYKKKYEANQEKTDQLLAENNKEVNTFANTGCVEGSWKVDDHEELVPISYFCVRAGARLPDTTGEQKVIYNGDKIIFDFGEDSATDGRKFAGMTKSPWWHGYFTTNYIKAVIYETWVADSYGAYGNDSGAVNTIGYDNTIGVKKSLETLSKSSESGWKYILLKLQKDNEGNEKVQNQGRTKGFKRAVIWGMAIHSATDTYAHSVKYRGTPVLHTDYSNNADNIDYIRNRYEDAATIAEQMMSRYISKDGLATIDLSLPLRYTWNYELRNFNEYIQSVDSSISYSFYYSSK